MKMSQSFIVIELLLTLLASKLFAGGYVGNGGGLAEQNFNYAYTVLPRTIDSTLFTKKSLFDAEELHLLTAIKAIAQQNVSREDRLTFVSGKDFPGLFKTGPTEHHRIAVTGNAATALIYVNTDLLYNAEGSPLLDLGTQSAILVHEIGHQAGELNHQKLDILGTKIRAHFNQSAKIHEIHFAGANQQFVIINQKGDLRTAELLFQDGKHLRSLNQEIFAQLKSLQKAQKYQSLSGFELTNGNFKLELYPKRLVFQVWIAASYYTKGSFSNELLPIEFEVLADGTLQVLPSK